MSNDGNNLRQFEQYDIDLDKKVLWYQNSPVELPIKAVELLCALIESEGEIVGKDELLDRVWHDSFVEESVLSQNVYLLRKIFKQHGIEENLIQTVPRRGYRFASQVSRSSADEIVIERETIERKFIGQADEESLEDFFSGKDLPTEPDQIPETATRQTRSKFSRTHQILAIGLIGLIAVSGFLVWNYSREKNNLPVENIRTIAVLPFKAINKSEQTETFSLGLTDNLISRLGSLNLFTVSPYTAVDKFSESGEDALAFGKKLKVDGVLVGTIQEDGEHLRINVRFIDTRTGAQIWSNDFEESKTDIFRLQDNLSKQVAKNLSINISPEQQNLLTRKITDSPDAYRAFLKGDYFQRMMTADSLKNSVASYEKAIELDSDFAEAYINLANAQYLIFASEYDASLEYPKRAQENLKRGLNLQPNSLKGLLLQADIAANIDWNWTLADELLTKAIELEPTADVYAKRGFLLLKRGRFDQAKRDLNKAKNLDPTSITTTKNLGMAHFYAKEYAEAETLFRETLQLNPEFVRANWFIIRIFNQTNRKKEAVDLMYDYLKAGKNGDLPEKFKAKSASASAEEMIRFYATERLAAHKKRSPDKINPIVCANLSALAENKEETIYWLEKAVAEKRNTVTWMKIEPEFEFIRADPRFIKLLQKIRLSADSNGS
jgi:DNA-binding winged helix-turn-helix (wHTH) protein/TolB-like protein/Flp pilus assembly protein TadD